MPDDSVEGGCLCSAVRYRIAGTPLARSRCHCRSCRLASGAPSVAWVVVRRSDFAYARGEPSSFRSSPPVVRSFCGSCGTPLTYQHDDSPDTIDVTTATLDHPERFPPTREIWLEHRLAWETLNPMLVHYARDSADDASASP
jgi:hypothetical protein